MMDKKEPQGAIGVCVGAVGANGPAGPDFSVGQLVSIGAGKIMPIAGYTASSQVFTGVDFGIDQSNLESAFINRLKKLIESKNIDDIHALVDKAHTEYLVESVIDS